MRYSTQFIIVIVSCELLEKSIFIKQKLHEKKEMIPALHICPAV